MPNDIKQQIKSLEQDILQKERLIKMLQSACQHSSIRVREFPDTNAGWGGSNTCELCGKELNCWTRMKQLGDKPANFVKDKIVRD